MWASAVAADGSAARWYKGNTHAHTFWSDGDEFPEMVAAWYKDHGYDFLGISDHNCLRVGDAWKPVGDAQGAVPNAVVDACQKRFGADWLEFRTKGDQCQVKLKTSAEFEPKLAEPGKFLFIQNEEITTKFEDRHVHLNVLNLAEAILPLVGQSVAETISLNVAAAEEQATRLNRSMLVHYNHPGFAQFDTTAEELAASTARFFEVANACSDVHNPGDESHPSVEKIWDIVNTIRIAKMNAAPLVAFGSDDTHSYHQSLPDAANPGRSWIMVRAKELTPESLIDAMNRADFYVSTGVVLRDIVYDAKQRAISVVVEPEPGVSYAIEFIGTLEGADPTGQPAESKTPNRPGSTYSPEIGKVLSRVEGTSATYQLTGKELYVRPVVRSSKPRANPPSCNDKLQQAWCQPVGWESHITSETANSKK